MKPPALYESLSIQVFPVICYPSVVKENIDSTNCGKLFTEYLVDFLLIINSLIGSCSLR